MRHYNKTIFLVMVSSMTFPVVLSAVVQTGEQGALQDDIDQLKREMNDRVDELSNVLTSIKAQLSELDMLKGRVSSLELVSRLLTNAVQSELNLIHIIQHVRKQVTPLTY